MKAVPRFHPAAGTDLVSGDGSACTTCGHLACVCGFRARHAADCKFLLAAAGPIGIACDDHGRDCCPVCDPCTCEAFGQKAAS